MQPNLPFVVENIFHDCTNARQATDTLRIIQANAMPGLHPLGVRR